MAISILPAHGLADNRVRALPREFYSRATLTVARELVGKVLCARSAEGSAAGRIVEVEAYVGPDDPASHAFRGQTRRSARMWGPPGHAYVYVSHGIHHCLNVVTEAEGYPAAVLIRAVEPLEGIDLMKTRRRRDDIRDLTTGPGKLCKAFGIDLADNGIDLTGERLFIGDGDEEEIVIAATPRIGVGQGQDQRWRFAALGSVFVSARRPGPGDVVEVA